MKRRTNGLTLLTICALTVCCILPRSGPGAEDVRSNTNGLSLADCVGTALTNSPLLHASSMTTAAASETVGETKAAYYPTIGISGSYSRWQKLAFLPSGLPLGEISPVIGPTDDWSIGATARYVLYDSGGRSAKVKTAGSVREAAASEEARIRQDVVMTVHQAYYEYVAGLEARAVAKKILARAEDHLRLAQDRNKAGAVPDVDVSRSRVEVADSKLSVLRAESRVRVAAGNLNTVMGLAPDKPLNVSGKLETPATLETIDPAKAFDAAVAARPDVKAALQRITAAQSEVDAARSASWPTVSAQGSYGRRGGELVGDETEWLAGIAVDIPIFSGFSTKHRVARTKSVLSKEKDLYDQTVLNVRQEVWTAHSKLAETFEAVQATSVQMDYATESLGLMEKRYKSGACTINDLLDSKVSLEKAETGHVEAQKDYHIAAAAFKRAMGVLSSESKQ